MNKFQLYEEVLVEWLENDWHEATIQEIWEDKYFVQIKDTDIKITVENSQIKRKNENVRKFF